MRKSMFFACLSTCAMIACNKVENPALNIEEQAPTKDLVKVSIKAGTPSDTETKVVITGDSASEPIQVMWRGSTDSFREQFALVLHEDGNMWSYPATRSADEILDKLSGIFEAEVEVGEFDALYPYKEPDAKFMTGSDTDKMNWVYKLDGQSGFFDDVHKYDFMTGTTPVYVTTAGLSSVQFQHEVAILRLSDLSFNDLSNTTVTGLTLKSDAIADAAAYRYTFSEYSYASTDITLNGAFHVGPDGKIDNNIYVVFFPRNKELSYFKLVATVGEKTYQYSYSGSVKTFTKGKVYTLRGVEMKAPKVIVPTYDWYTNPVGEDLFELSDINDFIGFANLVNGVSGALSATGESEAVSFSGKTVQVKPETSIDLKEYLGDGNSWVPISNFSGTFLGNGVSISNIYNDLLIDRDYGLFGYVNNAVIDGVNISGSIECNVQWNKNFGGLVGNAMYSTISNCSSSVRIQVTNKSYGRSIGTLCGRMYMSYILGCSADSDMYVSTYDSDYDFIGGISGVSSSYSAIIAAQSKGSIASGQKTMVGGICGLNQSDGTIYSAFSDCEVSGYYPGYIACTTGSIRGTILSCYYTGSSSLGFGWYNNRKEDYNSSRVTDVNEAVNSMNTAIEQWNTNKPDHMVGKRYYNQNDQIVFE